MPKPVKTKKPTANALKVKADMERVRHSIKEALTKRGREGRCTASRTGNHREKGPCERFAMAGGSVCYVHGGNAPQVKRAAKKRLLAEVDPTIARLMEIRDQNMHMPSALGATQAILNRTLGKVGETPKEAGIGKFTINIGVALGSVKSVVEVVPQGAIEGEVADEDDAGEDDAGDE